MTAPAFRLPTRAYRVLVAMRTAVSTLTPLSAAPIDVTSSLPSGLRHLRPGSVIVGTPGARRSVVLRLIDERGVARAALKLAVTHGTDEGIRQEVEALRDSRVAHWAPKLLHVGDVAGHQAMITTYVPGAPVRYGPRGINSAARLCSHPDATTGHVWAAEHPWIITAADIAGVEHEAVVRALPRRLPRTRTHGDFAPWNLLGIGKSRVVAIDWEASTADGLPVADLAHFVMASEQLLRKAPPEDAVTRATSVLNALAVTDERAAWMIVGLAASSTAWRERASGGPVDAVANWEAAARYALAKGV